MNGQVLSAVEWVYTVTTAVPTSHAAKIEVTACDLAGNVSVASQALPARA